MPASALLSPRSTTSANNAVLGERRRRFRWEVGRYVGGLSLGRFRFGLDRGALRSRSFREAGRLGFGLGCGWWIRRAPTGEYRPWRIRVRGLA